MEKKREERTRVSERVGSLARCYLFTKLIINPGILTAAQSGKEGRKILQLNPVVQGGEGGFFLAGWLAGWQAKEKAADADKMQFHMLQ